jgi:hypothetical protein
MITNHYYCQNKSGPNTCNEATDVGNEVGHDVEVFHDNLSSFLG